MLKRPGLLMLMASTALIASGCREAPNAVDSLKKAETLYAAHDYAAARVELMNALQADPKNVKALLLDAENSLQLADGDGAERAIKLAREAGATEASTKALLIRAYLQQMLPEKALDLVGKDAGPNDSAEIYRLRGSTYAALEKDKEASAHYEAGLAKFPDDPRLLVSVARLRYIEKNLPEAEKLAARAVALDDKSFDTLIINADIALAKGDLATAKSWFDKAAKAYPLNLQAKLGQATVLWQQNDRKGAMVIAEQVLKADPKSPVAIMMKATTLADAGKEEEAITLMKTTIPFFEQDPTALRIKGDLEMKKGYPASAVRYYQQAVNQMPRDATLRFRLARAMMKDDDLDGARAAIAPVANDPALPADLKPLL